MNPRIAHLLVCLYPHAWRERYGAEFKAHLQAGPGGLRATANVLWSALHERALPTQGLVTDRHPSSVLALSRRPSAFLPMAMSLAALTLVLGHVAIHGVAREADEGTVAHLWQLLMAGQMPVVALFVIKWLPRTPGKALRVLALQVAAALASVAPVFFLKL